MEKAILLAVAASLGTETATVCQRPERQEL
jgi:hypothetical protein